MIARRLLAVVMVIGLFAGTSAPALADDDGDEHRGDNRGWKEQIIERANNFRERFQLRHEERDEKKEERDRQNEEKRTEKIEAFWARSAQRMQRFVDQLRRIADRVQERIDRLEDAGKNVDEAQVLLDDAREAMDDAEDVIARASASIDDILADNEPRGAFKKLRDLHRQVLDEVKAAHRALSASIRSIRGLSATPTPTPTP